MTQMPHSNSPLMDRRRKIVTAAVFYCFFTLGVTITIPGPTLQDIAQLTRSSFADISHGIAVRSAGYAAGALSTGHLFRRTDRQTGFIVCLILSGVATFCIPISRSLFMYYAVQVIYGFAAGGIDVAANAWILELWGSGSNPLLQGMYFCYAIGATTAPLLVTKFMSETLINAAHLTEETKSMIIIPFGVAAMTSFIGAGVLTYIYYALPCSAEQKHVRIEVEGETTGTASYRTTIIIFACILIFAYPGSEFNSFTFLSQFLVNTDQGISKSNAAFMQTVMSAAFATSRGLCIVIATKISPRSMMFTSIACLGTAYTILLACSETSVPGIYVALVIAGVGYGPMTPSTYSFLRKRIDVKDNLCGLFMFSKSLAQITVAVLMGLWIESNHMIFLFTNIMSLIVTVATVGAFIVNDSLHSDNRYQKLP